MNQVRIIKKYPNRRLYDSAESRYITLNDVRQLVVDGHRFEVIDKKTGHNITRSILLQVITEQELHGHAVLSEEFLARIIRCVGDTPPELVRVYLEDSLGLFLEQQDRINDREDDGCSDEPANLAHHHLERWLELQTAMLRSSAAPEATERGVTSTGKPPEG